MEANKTNQLVLKPVNQLSDYNFFIPSYQRGYRWTKTQVEQLLNDVWDFARKPPQHEPGKEKPFYCLQPVVTKKKKENQREVIDGQQRLTTIFLIVHYFNEMWIGKQKIKEPTLLYETRNDSSIFLSSLEIKIADIDVDASIEKSLSDIQLKSIFEPEDNIDFHHIANAYKSIHLWVEQKRSTLDTNIFQSVFLHDTKVIWYEAEESESNNSIDIFTRLNIGKIPLTNSELIKALFLQKGNFAKEKATLKQIHIASEWDIIEKKLQDDAFWFFIYNPTNPIKYDNRIEYIFDLKAERTKESEFYHTFNKFNEYFITNIEKDKPDIDRIWLKIKRYFWTFEEWYENYELFHYIGYLIDCGIPIKTLKEKSSGIAKDKFKNDYIKGEIRKQVNCNIDVVVYKDKVIKKILLLFNIQTVLETQKSDMRFPFHKYKSENWDIEHVSSQTEHNIVGNKRITWVNDILEYFAGTTDILEAQSFIKSIEDKEIRDICHPLIKLKKTEKKGEKMDDKNFDDTFKLVQKYFKEDSIRDEKDSISNLALLDSTTNRSYGNSFFPIKRNRIIKNDSKGIFVPIATKNLFLKYYSNKFGDVMHWNSHDAFDYLKAIKMLLKEYLQKED